MISHEISSVWLIQQKKQTEKWGDYKNDFVQVDEGNSEGWWRDFERLVKRFKNGKGISLQFLSWLLKELVQSG